MMFNRHNINVEIARLAERIAGLGLIVDEKFVRHGTMLDAQAKQVALALAAAEKAIEKAEVSTNQRLEGMNEFRRQLEAQAAMFMPRKETEQLNSALADKMDTASHQVTIGDQKLDERIKLLERGSSNLQGRFWALGAVVVLVNLAIALFVK